MEGAVLVKADGPVTEPRSTGNKPDKIIVLFRHFVRALLIPSLSQVLDTQAGFKAFDAAALGPAIGQVASFNETFDVELLIHLAQHYGQRALAVEPIVFTEDFAASNFPSIDPGARHLAMVQQIVDVYDRLVAPIAPVTGEAADLLTLVRTLELDGYVTLIEQLRTEDPGDPTLFDRRWHVQHLRDILRLPTQPHRQATGITERRESGRGHNLTVFAQRTVNPYGDQLSQQALDQAIAEENAEIKALKALERIHDPDPLNKAEQHLKRLQKVRATRDLSSQRPSHDTTHDPGGSTDGRSATSSHRPTPHIDHENGIAWASSTRSARTPDGQVIPAYQRTCVSVTVLTIGQRL
jgi:hypothetical protein